MRQEIITFFEGIQRTTNHLRKAVAAGCFRFVVVLIVLVNARHTIGETLLPTSYDMPNGGSSTYSYWDDNYNGSGNKTVDYAPLSGGLGDLTDGVIASHNWNYGNDEHWLYVGWTINPVITFHFEQDVNLDSMTLYLDDSNNTGMVMPPSQINVSAGGIKRTYAVDDPSSGDPFALTLTDIDLTGNSIDVQLFNRSIWMMLSEVQFAGSVVPEPSISILLGTCALGLFGWFGGANRKRREIY
jgi:hypothetical protein